LSAVVVLGDGSIVLGNVAGDLLRIGNGSRTVWLVSAQRKAPIAALAQAEDGSIIAAGLAGVVRLPESAATSAIQGDAR
jgi:hypothetical protein